MSQQKEEDKKQRKEFLEACKSGKPSRILDMIELGMSPDVRSKSGRSGLHFGAREGHTKVVEVLIKAGADVNARNKWMETPLHAAAYNGRADIVKILLEAGADPTLLTDHGKTPLEFAKTCQKKGKFKKQFALTVEALTAATTTKSEKT